MSDPCTSGCGSDEGPKSDVTIQINYIIVPLILILFLILCILVMRYQSWCAWKLFRPTITKTSEPVEIASLEPRSVVVLDPLRHSTTDSNDAACDRNASHSAEQSFTGQSPTEQPTIHPVTRTLRIHDSQDSLLETRAIVYSGAPPSYSL